MRPIALSIVLLAFYVTEANAQSDSVLTKALSDPSSLLGRITADSNRTNDLPKVEIRAIRLASSSGGFMFGIVLGGFAGHELGSRNCSGKSCRETTADALLTGAAIGGAAGAGLGAAFLNLRSVCAFDRRILRTLIGAAVGASALYAAGGGLEKRRGRSAFFTPIGAIGGSLGTLGPCWKMRF